MDRSYPEEAERKHHQTSSDMELAGEEEERKSSEGQISGDIFLWTFTLDMMMMIYDVTSNHYFGLFDVWDPYKRGPMARIHLTHKRNRPAVLE